MSYTANSIIEVFSGVKLNKDSEDTIYFGTVANQNNYFGDTTQVNRVFRETDYQFIRAERETIRVHANKGLLENCNYLRFKNPNYGDKWFYAFLTDTKYINDNCTEIEFEIDPMQTWIPNVDYDLNGCGIVRQHQAVIDRIGDNIEPENIQVTAYSPKKVRTSESVSPEDRYKFEYNPYANGYHIALMFPYTEGKDDNNTKLWYRYLPNSTSYRIFLAQTIDKVPTGNLIALFNPNNVTEREYLLTAYRVWGDLIINEWVIPDDFIDFTDYVSTSWVIQNKEDPTDSQYRIFPKVLFKGHASSGNVVSDGEINAKESSFSITVSHDGFPFAGSYTPKNKKMFTNPFSFLQVMTPTGQNQTLCFEKMKARSFSGNVLYQDGDAYFKVIGTLMDTNITIIPYGYDNAKLSYTLQSGLPKAPTLATKGGVDSTTNRELLSGIIQLGVTGVVGAATGGTALPLLGGALGGIGGNMITNAITPKQGGGSVYNLNNSGIWANSLRSFEFYYLYADNYEKIDKYFSYYGYRQNTFGVPNIEARRYFTFVQTEKARFISKHIPAKALREIETKFNNGIRFHRYNELTNSVPSLNNIEAALATNDPI